MRVGERCAHWSQGAPEMPWSRAQFAFSFYSLKPYGAVSKQVRFYRSIYGSQHFGFFLVLFLFFKAYVIIEWCKLLWSGL